MIVTLSYGYAYLEQYGDLVQHPHKKAIQYLVATSP